MNTQFLHAGMQRFGIHSQDGGGTNFSTYLAFSLFESLHNVISLHVIHAHQ